VFLLVLLSLTACDIDGDGYVFKSSPNIHIADSEFRESVKAALDQKGVNYRTRIMDGGKEYILWDESDNSEAQVIISGVVGEPPPHGRAIGIRPSFHLLPISEAMEKVGIPHTIISYYGNDYLVWPEGYTRQVQQLNNGEFASLIMGSTLQ
jgi:hypothetical protein